MKTSLHKIEPLEARIAPALSGLTILNPLTATYTDVDGDHVTVKVSAGTLVAGDFSGVTMGSGAQLQLLTLTDAGFLNASVTFTVVKAAGGDGLAAVGRIDATGQTLGKVTVKGDLGDIDATAVAALTARSMGLYDTATQAGGGSLESDIGTLGSLTLTNDLSGVHVKVTTTIGAISIGGSIIGGHDGGADFGEISSGGKIGTIKIVGDLRGSPDSDNSGSIVSGGAITSISIGGSLIGSETDGSGSITAVGDIGSLKVGHNILGGSGAGSGAVSTQGALLAATIGGSVIGGVPDGSGTSADDSGEISTGGALGTLTITHDLKGGGGLTSGTVEAGGVIKSITVNGSLIGGTASGSGSINNSLGDIGTIKIGHDVVGGTAVETGEITGEDNVGSVSIGGSLLGSSKTDTGEISVGELLGTVTIGHDFHGGSVYTANTTISRSGEITADRITSVTIGGSVIAGENNGNSTAHLFDNASIQAAHDIGSITVKGSVVGNGGDTGAGQTTNVLFTAQGQETPTATSDVAIGKITIGGEVEHTEILAGYNTSLSPIDSQAQIGTVSVKGDWIASDLVDAAKDVNGDGFGGADDTKITAGTTIAKIASITIGGIVIGTPENVSDGFGFEAPAIGALKINGATVAIVSPTILSPLTGGDVTLRLV